MAQSPRGPWACRWQPQIRLSFPVLLQTGDTHLPVHRGEQQDPVTTKWKHVGSQVITEWDTQTTVTPGSFEKSHSKSGEPLSHLVLCQIRCWGRNKVYPTGIRREQCLPQPWEHSFPDPWYSSPSTGVRALKTPGCRAPRKHRDTDGFHGHPSGYNLQSRAFLFLVQCSKGWRDTCTSPGQHDKAVNMPVGHPVRTLGGLPDITDYVVHESSLWAAGGPRQRKGSSHNRNTVTTCWALIIYQVL